MSGGFVGIDVSKATLDVTVRPFKDTATEELRALLGRRRQLLEMFLAERNRLGIARSAAVRKSVQRHIQWRERRLADVDRGLGTAIEASRAWRSAKDLLRSVPGVGPVVSRTLPANCRNSGD